jgi:hypothetical protein
MTAYVLHIASNMLLLPHTVYTVCKIKSILKLGYHVDVFIYVYYLVPRVGLVRCLLSDLSIRAAF